MINKTKLALGIATATLTMTGALVSSDAMAHSKKHKLHTVTESSSSSSYSSTSSTNSKVDALEAQVQAMQAELSRLRADSSRPQAEAGKVQELDEWMASVKSAPKESKKSKDNMVFFRGGYAHMFTGRNDILTMGQTILDTNNRTNQDGSYMGAGFDFSLSDNLFGFMDKTEVLAEMMFEYKHFGVKHSNVPGAPINTLCAVGGETGSGGAGNVLTDQSNCHNVTVSQFTLAASPKIKFMKGSAFRPWIIPVGLALHVISPPSNGVTVFNPGAMFAAGADYKIWKDIYVGADARYHWTADNADGVKTDGLTAGGYLGIGF